MLFYGVVVEKVFRNHYDFGKIQQNNRSLDLLITVTIHIIIL